MKRSWAALLCAVLLTAGGAALYAESSTSFSLQPSEMKEGETKTFTDGGKTITIRREGNSMTVRIDQADETDRLTITREAGRLRIAHGTNGVRTFEMENLPRLRTIPREMSTHYVCPQDKTMLRVPEGSEEKTYKCPVDGTTMEKRKGRGLTFLYLGDGLLESNVL